MKLIILGAPGSGKGTQASLLVDRFNLSHVSTGDVFRKAINEETDLGKKAKRFLDEGLLVPDEIVLGMIDGVMSGLTAEGGFILDGFPRTNLQAEAFEIYLKKQGEALDAAISLDVPKSSLVERLLSRKRADDTRETIEKRLSVYEEQTAPMKKFYRSRGLLREVDGSGSVQQVFQSLVAILS